MVVASVTTGSLFIVDEQTYKDRVKRLQAVNAVVSKLDGAIRAEAFTLLAPTSPAGTQRKVGPSPSRTGNLGTSVPG